MSEDYNPLGVPKGCELRIRADRSSYYQPKFEPPPKTQFLIAREIPKPAPTPAPAPTLTELQQQELVRVYRSEFLSEMRIKAKELTERSTFPPASIEAWESGVDSLLAELVRYF